MARGGQRAGAGRKPAPGESFEAARRRKESALADLRGIEVHHKRGALVDVRAVEKRMFELVRAEREAWLNWPATIAPELATALGADPAKTEVVLERLVRHQIASLTAEHLRGAVHAA